MDIIDYVLLVFLIILNTNLVYLWFFALAGFFYKKPKNENLSIHHKFLILIPAFKSDKVLLNTVSIALKQEYPKDLFQILIGADEVADETISKLEMMGAEVCRIPQGINKKGYALKLMLASKTDFDYAVVLDVDNIIEVDFLKRVNQYIIPNEAQVFQAHRKALNTDTPLALLDALSEEVNNHIFRKGHRAVGLPSALIGSGMVLPFELFKKWSNNLNTVVEDKELELLIIEQKINIEYLFDINVLDEKTRDTDSLARQRQRWVSGQFLVFKLFFFKSLNYLFKGNFAYFEKVLQAALLPRILVPAGFAFLVLISILFHLTIFLLSLKSLFLTILLFVILCPPYLRKRFNKDIIKILPKLVWIYVLNMFKMSSGAKKFNPTKHK